MLNKALFSRNIKLQANVNRMSNNGSKRAKEQTAGQVHSRIRREPSLTAGDPLASELDIFWGNYLKFNLASEAMEGNLRREP